MKHFFGRGVYLWQGPVKCGDCCNGATVSRRVSRVSWISFVLFISTSGGKVYTAQVKERATARKIYDAAKKQGKTAGLIATKLVPDT